MSERTGARAALSSTRPGDADDLRFHCPGCRHDHIVPVNPPDGRWAHAWDWNGNLDRPTLNPSVGVNLAGMFHVEHLTTCHSFVRDGWIEYLPDTTHDLAGQTVEIPTQEG